MLLRRVLSIVKKEFIQLRRDRRSVAMIVLIPVMEMVLFGYALSTNITHVPLVVLDADNSSQSRMLIEGFRQTDFFDVKYYALDYDDITSRIESGGALAALVIPPDYSRRLLRGEGVSVQFLVDGANPSVGVQALANASLIVRARGAEIAGQALSGAGLGSSIAFQARVWYNPAMQSSTFYLPGVVGVILQFMTTQLSAFAIVRERESGTIEQLNVTPLKRGELIVAKLIPYVIVAYIQIVLILAMAVFVFAMPMRGSLFLLLGLSSVFLMFSLGIGLLVSSVSRTQFQAMQLSMMILLPSILLTGFLFPIESMPRVAQWVSTVLPLTYFLRITRSIVVKGVGIEYLWQDALILAAMGVVTLMLAATRLRRTEE